MAGYIWILTYALPAFFAYSTRWYASDSVSRAVHVSLVIISIALSWLFIETFYWGFETIFLGVFAAAAVLSIILLRNLIFVISAVVQQICLLFAATLATPAGYPFVVLIFSLMHPTTSVKIGSLFLGSVSVFLYIYFETVLLSITLHILLLSGLILWRKKQGHSLIHSITTWLQNQKLLR